MAENKVRGDEIDDCAEALARVMEADPEFKKLWEEAEILTPEQFKKEYGFSLPRNKNYFIK